MVDNKVIIQQLMELGFSEYESRAYIALLARHPATPYEIARESSISSAKIYEVIAKLAEKGLVSGFMENERKKYFPKEPGDFIAWYQHRTDTVLAALKANLEGLQAGGDDSYIWNIGDPEYLSWKAQSLIAGAGSTLLVSLWREEARLLATAIAAAQKRKVKTAVVLFGMPDESDRFKQVFYHPIAETISSEKGGRGLSIVADSTEVLTAVLHDDGRVEGACSRNRGFAAMTEDYIKHDIYIMKIVKRFDRELVSKFGDGYPLLRDIFDDKEVV